MPLISAKLSAVFLVYLFMSCGNRLIHTLTTHLLIDNQWRFIVIHHFILSAAKLISLYFFEHKKR